eukprot:155889_1
MEALSNHLRNKHSHVQIKLKSPEFTKLPLSVIPFQAVAKYKNSIKCCNGNNCKCMHIHCQNSTEICILFIIYMLKNDVAGSYDGSIMSHHICQNCINQFLLSIDVIKFLKFALFKLSCFIQNDLLNTCSYGIDDFICDQLFFNLKAHKTMISPFIGKKLHWKLWELRSYRLNINIQPYYDNYKKIMYYHLNIQLCKSVKRLSVQDMFWLFTEIGHTINFLQTDESIWVLTAMLIRLIIMYYKYNKIKYDNKKVEHFRRYITEQQMMTFILGRFNSKFSNVREFDFSIWAMAMIKGGFVEKQEQDNIRTDIKQYMYVTSLKNGMFRKNCCNERCLQRKLFLTKLKLCSVCKSCHYCCKRCQKVHWNTVHRYQCQKLAAI